MPDKPTVRRSQAQQPADELRYLILAAQREGSRRLAGRLRTASLTPAQAEVLEVLRDRAPLTLADLGRLLVCEAGSPSRLVDSLVRRGLVTRTPGDNDRRIVTLALTPAGHGTLAGSSGTDDVRDIITSRLTGDEIEQLAGLLRRLLAGTQGGTAVAARFPSPGPAPGTGAAPPAACSAPSPRPGACEAPPPAGRPTDPPQNPDTAPPARG